MRRSIIPYNPKLKERARELRRQCTPAEAALWKRIKSKQLLGYDFDRQKPINNFIVDFYCKDLMLAIELDGESHANKNEYDLERDIILSKLGIKTVRYTNDDIFNSIENICNDLMDIIRNREEALRNNNV